MKFVFKRQWMEWKMWNPGSRGSSWRQQPRSSTAAGWRACVRITQKRLVGLKIAEVKIQRCVTFVYRIVPRLLQGVSLSFSDPVRCSRQLEPLHHPVWSVLKLPSYFSGMLRFFFLLCFVPLSHVQRKLGRRPTSRSTAATSRQLRALWKLFRLWLSTKATWLQVHSGWNLDSRSCRTW